LEWIYLSVNIQIRFANLVITRSIGTSIYEAAIELYLWIPRDVPIRFNLFFSFFLLNLNKNRSIHWQLLKKKEVGISERLRLRIWHTMLGIILLYTYSTYTHTSSFQIASIRPSYYIYSPTENDVYLLMNRVIQFVFFSPARIFLQKEFGHMPSTMIKRFFISIPFVITRSKYTHTHTAADCYVCQWHIFVHT